MNKAYSDFKNAWITELYAEWSRANHYYFDEMMRPPVIDLSSSESRLGSWEGGLRRRLCISIHIIEKQKWQYTQEVLYHEMAHQYVEEVLHIADGPPHGELFKKICSRHSIDPSASGSVDQWLKRHSKTQGIEHKRLDKVRKLFSLAQSSNQHEAELAMTRARELLLRYNLSIKISNPEYSRKQIGKIGRRSAVESLVAGIISEFFFVETLWAFGYDPLTNVSGRILEIFGREENLEIAEYVYFYLLNVIERLWENHKAEHGIKGNRNRRTFLYGLLNGFREKLVKENKTASSEKGLVWTEDPLLSDFFRKKHPNIRKSSIRCNSSCSDTYEYGLSKGKMIVLNKGISQEKNGSKLIESVD